MLLYSASSSLACAVSILCGPCSSWQCEGCAVVFSIGSRVGGYIIKLRWMQALLCGLVSVGTGAESIVINCMLLCMSCSLPYLYTVQYVFKA